MQLLPISLLLMCATFSATFCANLSAQPVRAPHAQSMVTDLITKHPEMQTIGLHVVPPGQMLSVNIACSKPGKVGKVSAAIDNEVASTKKPSLRRTANGAFDMGLPISDASGQPIGMVVIVVPSSFTTDATVALKQAGRIRDELSREIPNLAALFTGATVVSSPLSMIAQTPLPEVTGSFDHFAVDLRHDRLYVAAEGNHSIEVFTLAGEHVRSVGGVKTPHTLAYVPDLNLLFVADGGDSSCVVLDGGDLHLVKSIALPAGPDAGVYDPASRRFYIGSGGAISIVSVDEQKVVGRIPVDSTNLESMVIDHAANTLYVNLRDKARIGVVSLETGSMQKTWNIPGLTLNTPMALDEPSHRLFVAGRKPGKLFIVDTLTGTLVQSFDCIETADDMTFDSTDRRIYVTGAGGVSIYSQQDANRYSLESQFGTMQGKTSVYVPSMRQFYTIHAKTGEDGAALQVYQVAPAHSELYAIEQNGRWGFMNAAGEMVLKPVYEAAAHFQEGLAPVKIKGHFGYIDHSGTIRIQPQFEEARFFYKGLAPVRQGDLWGYIDPSGAFAIAPRFEVVRSFQDDAARVRLKGLWGFIDLQGQLIIPPKFEGANGFNDGLAPVQSGKLWGFIDKSGTFAIKPQFEFAHSFGDGLADVKVAGKWGYIDKTGHFLIPPKFEETAAMSDGLAPVKANGKWGYIQSSGSFAIEPKFDDAKSFEQGLAEVHLGKHMAYIDHKGRVVGTLP